MTDAPAQDHKIIRKIIPGFMQPILRGLRKRFFRLDRPKEDPYRTVFPYTQAHPVRQKSLLNFAYDIDARNVPGVIVECGVLDGGTAALMAFGSSKSGRKIHLFDSWRGLPEATVKDGEGSQIWSGDLIGSPARVQSVMRRLNINSERLTFHKGWFDQTFPKAHIDRIALLHIDADFYDSVRLCLEAWYPKVSPGGYIQFDDYSIFIGCTRAVDEFLLAHQELSLKNIEGLVFFIQKPASDM
jgi:O-methyltransferase